MSYSVIALQSHHQPINESRDYAHSGAQGQRPPDLNENLHLLKFHVQLIGAVLLQSEQAAHHRLLQFHTK